jgi:hypothetical protein
MRGRITQNQRAPKPIRIRANTTSRLRTLDFRGGGERGAGFSSVGLVVWVLILVRRPNRRPRYAIVDSRIYWRYQNDFRETSPGKTSHIDDVINLGMTGFYDKRPILGTKGYGEGVQVRGVQELQEFGSSGATNHDSGKLKFR